MRMYINIRVSVSVYKYVYIRTETARQGGAASALPTFRKMTSFNRTARLAAEPVRVEMEAGDNAHSLTRRSSVAVA